VTWTAAVRRYLPWRAVAVLAAFLFAIVAIPTRTATVVAPAGCVQKTTPLLGAQTSCPLYRESWRGGVWTWTATLSERPVGATTDAAAYRSVASVPRGFRVGALVGELLLCAAVAAALTLLLSLLRLRSTRTPAYGLVRRRRRF
jgi:hypothetical protein